MINCFAPEYLSQKIGLGALAPYSAVIHNEVDGDYYVDIVAPIEQEKLLYQDVVLEIVTQNGSIQPFRVGNVVKTGFKIKTTAYHITEDYKNCVVRSLNPSGTAHDADWFIGNIVPDLELPFTLYNADVTGTTSTLSLANISMWDALQEIAQAFDAHLQCSGTSIALQKTLVRSAVFCCSTA